jgi:hypothetical protein
MRRRGPTTLASDWIRAAGGGEPGSRLAIRLVLAEPPNWSLARPPLPLAGHDLGGPRVFVRREPVSYGHHAVKVHAIKLWLRTGSPFRSHPTHPVPSCSSSPPSATGIVEALGQAPGRWARKART